MKKIFLFSLLLTFNFNLAQANTVHKLQAFYGASLFKYSLASDQFNAEQPISAGNAFLLNYTYQNDESTQEHRVSLANANHKLSVPSSLTPSSINSQQTKLNYKLVANLENINVGAGYSFNKITAGETTPNILIASSELHAINLFIEKNVWHQSNLSVHVFTDLELPFIKKELTSNTGFNQNSYNIHLGYVAKYLLNDIWSILQKSEYSFESTSYDGQGSRGTLNAEEKFQRFQFLLGAGYDF